MAQNSTTTNAPQEPIHRQKLSDQVFDRLWDMIASGELVPGDSLPSERALMERFGVGRPAVREAMQTMANKGLITISHGERSRVNKPTASVAIHQIDDIAKLLLSTDPDNLEHLKQLRKILEAGTVGIAARKCTNQDAADLRALVEAQRASLGDDKAFIRTDIAFHVRLAKITGNPLLENATEAMLTWLFAYYRPLLHWSGREETTLLEHERMVALLEGHDHDGAVQMICDHLSRSDPLYVVDDS